MNSIMVIFPYKHQGTWVFDDEATGLVREPFVAGIDTMIDHLVKDTARKRDLMRFSPLLRFPAMPSAWNGGDRSLAVLGITPTSSRWRDGSVQHCSSISKQPPKRFTSKRPPSSKTEIVVSLAQVTAKNSSEFKRVRLAVLLDSPSAFESVYENELLLFLLFNLGRVEASHRQVV
jgi:hypothetical protein